MKIFSWLKEQLDKQIIYHNEMQATHGDTAFSNGIQAGCYKHCLEKIEESEIKHGSIISDLLQGKWVETDKVQEALGMTFQECFKIFDFSRTAEWWSIAGVTEEERSRNGQKVTTMFRVKHDDYCEWDVSDLDGRKVFVNHSNKSLMLYACELQTRPFCPCCGKRIKPKGVDNGFSKN